jgi:type IV secretory pathway VirB2 component (pilin)
MNEKREIYGMIKSTIAAMALGVSVAFTGAASALEMGSDKPITSHQ